MDAMSREKSVAHIANEVPRTGHLAKYNAVLLCEEEGHERAQVVLDGADAGCSHIDHTNLGAVDEDVPGLEIAVADAEVLMIGSQVTDPPQQQVQGGVTAQALR